MNIKYVVTGTGRCGTGYAARLLSSAGVPCGHEALYGLSGPDFQAAEATDPGIAADSSWLAAPFLKHLPDGVQVLHLVRHPQMVVDSLMRIRFFSGDVSRYQPYLDFARRHLRFLNKFETELEKAAYFWLVWNRLIEVNAPRGTPVVRVEQGADAILAALGIEPGERDLFDDKYYNTHGDLTRTWDLNELPINILGEMAEMAGRYGYALDTPPPRPERGPQVFWAVLLIPAVSEYAVSSVINAAMVANSYGFTRLMLPYMRTDKARNLLVKSFREMSQHPDDVLVMLDCDHEHPAGIIADLANHPSEMGVVGALAYRRSPPNDPLFFGINSDSSALNAPKQFELGEMYRCDVVGSGAIAIRRWVFDRLEAAGFEWPFFRYEYPSQFDYEQSEDVYFARCCHAAGISQYCNTSIEIPHLIRAVADSAHWKNRQEVINNDGS